MNKQTFELDFATATAVVVNLDNILYPEKDYLLQVYYLFSEFIEYVEQKNAKEILQFMQQEFQQNGARELFTKTAQHFELDSKYQYNFELLHENARLPLKLLLFQKSLELLQKAAVDRKLIVILINGKPEIAINKIKQMEWHGMEKYLKIYFSSEYGNSIPLTLEAIVQQNKLGLSPVLYISKTKEKSFEKTTNIKFYASMGVL